MAVHRAITTGFCSVVLVAFK
nr:unnamed protein product [Callosobruchus chinensis]